LNGRLAGGAGITGAAMGDIARKVELFNRAFHLAWDSISSNPDPLRFNTSQQLCDPIRFHIIAGATDAALIAAEVVTDIQRYNARRSA